MQWVHDPACLCGAASSVLAQWVKDPALLQLRCRWQMWLKSGIAVAVVLVQQLQLWFDP